MNIENQAIKLIKESNKFDWEWYISKYTDVSAVGLDPASHFFKYGRLLKRSPSRLFDTRYCIDTYTDINKSNENPLIDYLKSNDRNIRPTTKDQWHEVIEKEIRTSNEAWGAIDYTSNEPPVISYCIPIMGRLGDLQGTLRSNLDENEEYKNKIEFVIIAFGNDPELNEFLNSKFSKEISSGYLRVVYDNDTLDSWHFGKAKNTFKQHIRGKIYSSLDGDNFVTLEETRMLLEVANRYTDGFIFHHFSGKWGDGTSGRISMPTWVYRNVGYNPQLLPRQFDEMDVIIGSLIRYPALPFIGIDKERNAFTLSVFCGDFLKTENLPNQFHYHSDCRHVPPLNPRGEDYTDKMLHWRDMNNFNASLSALGHISNESNKEQYRSKLNIHKYKLIENIPTNEILSTMFDVKNKYCTRPVTDESICLFACVHDEEHFLSKFVSHYRKIGVTHFFIIDDHSSVPVQDLNLGRDVITFRPKVGNFRTSKTLWIESLMKLFIPEGTWVITVDADEFLQVPHPYCDLKNVTNQLESKGHHYSSGILLDMLPNPSLNINDLKNANSKFSTNFNYFLFKDSEPSDEYMNFSSIKWGFGSYGKISWRLDVRYHLFGTLDSLRKLPLFKYSNKRHLNQGFHAFHYLEKKHDEGHSIWESPPILPIFHYKMIKLFSETSRQKMLSMSAGYHSRTGDNINRIFAAESESHLEKFKSLQPHILHSSLAETHNFMD